MTIPIIYHDSQSLYLEFSTYVLRFPFSEGGLHQALKHIPRLPTPQGQLSGASNLVSYKSLKGHIVKQTLSKTTRRNREVTGFSDRARSGAAEIIRKFNFRDN